MPATLLSRPAADEFKPYYSTYIDRVPEGDIVEQLATQMVETTRRLSRLSETQAMHRYAPGKWSVKEVVGHLSDAERVFVYRALRIARADATPLPGFDENAYVPAGRFDARPIASLVSEFAAVRAATVAFAHTLDPEDAKRRGTASDYVVTPRALLYISAGHELHHRRLLEERYGVSA